MSLINHPHESFLTELARYINEKEPSVWMVYELRKWVISGHSVYNNPWSLTAEDGSPLDYLTAKYLINAQESALSNKEEQ